MSFDFATQKWTVLTTVPVEYPTWSSDSRYLYFTSYHGGLRAIYRVGVANWKLERVMSLKGIQPAQDEAALDLRFGLAPDGSFLLLTNPGGEEIYSLDFQTP